MKRLVVVESPTKARTIRKFLPSSYQVEASMGHVRDLPSSASEIPASVKKEKWARLGVNVKEGFEPLYVVPSDKKKTVKLLKDALKDADELYLATDEDREGESIGWHLLQVLKPTVPVKRMVFHEITKEAILKALDETREVDIAPRGRARGAAHPRPARRLLRLARPVEKDRAQALGGPRAVRRRPRPRRARVGAAGLYVGLLLGPQGHARPGRDGRSRPR